MAFSKNKRLPSMVLTTPLQHPPITSLHVAIIGAGAGGLISALELRQAGHHVTVFEQQSHIGGIWLYNPLIESDPLSLNPNRTVIHTSLYDSLRTNLPRESMGFQAYPFLPVDSDHRDPRRFPGHAEVLEYLKDFVVKFEIRDLIRFNTEVYCVRLVNEGVWRVRSKCRDVEGDELFDAVVVSNGHYTETRIAEIPGIDTWPGNQIHSHNYRIPEPFRDQVVILIGSSSSAVDISSELSGVCKEVHLAARSEGMTDLKPSYENMWFHSMIESAREDGSVVFKDGSVVRADIILHCTGYRYVFPFLETNGIVRVDDNRVGPLYKHVFPPALAPYLSFVGLPWKVEPFPLFELQAKWIAGILSGHISLPSKEEMMEDTVSFYSKLEASGVAKRYTHSIWDIQFEYIDWVASECGCEAPAKWRRLMYDSIFKFRCLHPNTYRDEWDDQELILQAYKEFSQC